MARRRPPRAGELRGAPPSPILSPVPNLHEVRTDDGVTLAVEHFPPPGDAHGACWLGHAFLANRRSLDRSGGGLASAIAAAGLHAYAVDLRGHGLSQPDGAPLPWTYADLIRHDLPAVTRFVRERHPDLRVGAVGHSLTGHAALAWLGTTGERPLDAVVTIGANIWLRRLEPSRVRWAKKRAVLGFLRGISLVAGKVPAKAVGFGSEDAPATFMREFLRWSRTDSWSSPEGVDYLASLARVRAPVLAVMGTGDKLLCHPVCGEAFHRRLTAAPLDLHVAGRGDLGFDPGHMEMVTDKRSKPLWTRIAAWLADRLGAAA
jgi:predicted alpha/beta hydrolase